MELFEFPLCVLHGSEKMIYACVASKGAESEARGEGKGEGPFVNW